MINNNLKKIHKHLDVPTVKEESEFEPVSQIPKLLIIRTLYRFRTRKIIQSGVLTLHMLNYYLLTKAHS